MFLESVDSSSSVSYPNITGSDFLMPLSQETSSSFPLSCGFSEESPANTVLSSNSEVVCEDGVYVNSFISESWDPFQVNLILQCLTIVVGIVFESY